MSKEDKIIPLANIANASNERKTTSKETKSTKSPQPYNFVTLQSPSCNSDILYYNYPKYI